MNAKIFDGINDIKQQLEFTKETKKILDNALDIPVEFAADIEKIEQNSLVSYLNEEELNDIAKTLRTSRLVKKFLTENTLPDSILKNLSKDLTVNRELEEKIFSTFDESLNIKQDATPELKGLFASLKETEKNLKTKVNELMTSNEFSKHLQENIYTTRDDRIVFQVMASSKSKVPGIVHDVSATNKTFYIEPAQIVPLNNKIRELKSKIHAELIRILAELTGLVKAEIENIKLSEKLLAQIDFHFAKARYAVKIQAVEPEITNSKEVILENMRHPLLIGTVDNVVSNDFEIGKEYKSVIITGSNTGGKTVTLKMVGLFCLMAASGFYVPAAEGTTLAVFDRVFCDIGDAQSIEESLSTFSSHMTNIISIVREAGERSLVLIDELGGGTDPEEGQALAKAVIAHLMDAGCRGIVTTHYTSLKEFAFRKEGLENASMAFDAESLRPLYRIQIGLPGSSNALSICRRLGLDESILSDAYENLSQDAKALTNILKSAEESRLAAQESLARTRELEKEWGEKISLLDDEREKLRKEREKLFLTAKAEAKRIVNEKVAEAEELVEEMEKIFAKEELSQADLIRARTLKNKVAATSYEREEEAVSPQYTAFEGGREGETVFVRSVGREGKLLSVNDKRKETEVQCGEMRLRCKFSDLMSINAPAVKKAPKKQEKKKSDVTLVRKFSAPRAPALELNVLGMTVSEAIPEVDAFIDQAVVSNIEEIKIIHGVGTGKLKAGIHDHLRHHKNVEEFRLGKYGEGETGVTFVKIK